MRSDEYDTAQMMKDLERQVSQLRSSRSSSDSPSLIEQGDESVSTSDSQTTQIQDADTRFAWSDDGWSMETW